MNSLKSTLRTCAWMTLISVSALGIVACVAPDRGNTTQNAFGSIHFNNDKGEEKCTLPIPETTLTANFSLPNQYCENNMVSTFWLENVPSATLIQFFENESCSNAKVPSNFFFLLKTVKQPTDWTPHGAVTHSIDALRHLRPGELIAGKHLRVEPDGAFVGSDLASKNLNERISCVYIERSQPAN
ncbi:hypothetical protein SAMN03159443_03945 [Pseudomonas sp. NFACC15-1]|uniref:hypothetical protein n=1 Tax=unclassified Pseudomonas TaxID=196821 RepID=UPI00087F84B3|nr:MULTISPECIES: hypothetical protein [unclassified Pseudomonas]SDA87150.1 hypothetical protein SAMN03159443_03945 [Pseudomonas sp. NFACC15-1]SDY78215.1 hypothetical protein SAMN03159380_04695 [Pseudomonas sp. NFACC14]